MDDKRNYRATRSYHNLQRAFLTGDGRYGFPRVLAQDLPDLAELRWVGFNYAKGVKDPERCVLHFFVDDYQFERVWSNPEAYLPLLKRFAAVVMPDFSTYLDFPLCLRLYNWYRNCWLARWWQDNGVTVIPQVGFGNEDEEEYDWFAEAIPRGVPVVISSVGTQGADREAARLFDLGYTAMIDRLQPIRVYLYGAVSRYVAEHYDVTCIDSLSKEIAARCKPGIDNK